MQQPETPVGPVPEVYSDTFQVTVTPFGVNMTFGLREPPSTSKPPTAEHREGIAPDELGTCQDHGHGA